MNTRALHILEYDKIIERLTSFANSMPGKELCKKLIPGTDIEVIRQGQQQTADAIARIFRKGSTSFGSNCDMSSQLSALKIGGSLDAAELLKIANLLDNVGRVKNYGRFEKQEDSQDTLSEYFDTLEPLSPLTSEIRRCIVSEDEISDDASPELRHIRRGILLTNDRIHEQLGKMVNGSMNSYLQDSLITMRDDRYCIPVKAEYKGQVSGIVHDQSSTGSTLFIEPAAVVEMNNKLRELRLQEKAEIEAILASLSGQASEHIAAIDENLKLMTTLDFIFAKAGLALDENATTPIFNEEHRFNIRKGRHPLIDKKRVVPIDVYAGEDFDMLIITGPNTGGKTVTLKTVGLLTLMGQAGLAIPAGDRSELSVFNEVFADIGDEQSIEQNLSTFSSHMTNTVSILKEADENSLCLFDELGAGTDPTEGAALAIAILNNLHARGARTLATTHYSELKVYALTTNGVQNASCEFDIESLQPTYRLLIGIPGKSNAFAISSKLGLSNDIIDEAKSQISQDNKKFEDLLTDLEKSRVTIEKERLEIEEYKRAADDLKKDLLTKQEKLDSSKEKILQEANEKAREILQEAKSVADDTIRTFHKAGPNASMQDLERARTKVNQKISERNEKLSSKNKNDDKPTHPVLKASQLRLGDSVKIVSMGLKGTVSTKPDNNGNMFVQCGIIRTKTNIRDLVLLKDDDSKDPVRKYYSSQSSSSSGDYKMDLSRSVRMKTEINLIGKNSDDAISELDKYLDDAYMSHLSSVRVVHGKGSGTLRKAVQNFLKTVPYVKGYKNGEYGEGDSGVTVVSFMK